MANNPYFQHLDYQLTFKHNLYMLLFPNSKHYGLRTNILDRGQQIFFCKGSSSKYFKL